MRISETFTERTYTRNLRNVKASLDEALARMSSGRRLRYASDDPESAAEVIKLTDEAQRLTMRRNGISQCRPWLQQTETAVSSLGNILSQAQTYAIQGSSSTVQAPQRLALAEQISGLRRQVEGLTNLRIAGRYIFSGTRTDTAPYAADGSYQGNSETIQIMLDEGTIPINLPGRQVFGDNTTGPAKLLGDLENALRTGTEEDIQALLTPLRDALQQNTATLAKVGNYRSSMEDADARIDDLQYQVSQRANDLGAADMAEAISDVAQFQQGYQATLAAGAKLYGPTFFDYLG